MSGHHTFPVIPSKVDGSEHFLEVCVGMCLPRPWLTRHSRGHAGDFHVHHMSSVMPPSWSLLDRRILGHEWTDGGNFLQFWQSPCSSLLKGANGSSAPGLLPSYSHLHISCCTGLSPGVSSTLSTLCWEARHTFWPRRVQRSYTT